MNFKPLVTVPALAAFTFMLSHNCINAQDKKIPKPILEIPSPGSVQPVDMPLSPVNALPEQRRRVAGLGSCISNNEVRTPRIENMPEFPGGRTGLMKYLREHLQYPADAVEQNVQGQVIAEVVVSETGTIDSINIKKSLSESCDREVVRILENMPRWKPGKIGNKPVACYYLIPIAFHINH